MEPHRPQCSFFNQKRVPVLPRYAVSRRSEAVTGAHVFAEVQKPDRLEGEEALEALMGRIFIMVVKD
jgi:hypothetical protein